MVSHREPTVPVSIGQHWLSHPTVWPQPFPILARLVPETGSMRLKTSVILLSIVNAVETAEGEVADEGQPVHQWITASGRSSSAGRILGPSAFAVITHYHVSCHINVRITTLPSAPPDSARPGPGGRSPTVLHAATDS